MSLKALIFDVDGTLADTERDGHRVAYNNTFAEFGLDWRWDEALYGELLAVTGGKERMRRYLDSCSPRMPDGVDVDELIRRLYVRKTEIFNGMLRSGAIPLRDGVARLFTEARAAGLRLAVATTTAPSNVDALIDGTLGKAARGWFDIVAAGDIVPQKKPAPDIYTYVLEQMGWDADDCLAFEDSANGVKAARAAGLRVIVTVNGYTRDEDFDGADLVLDGLGEAGHPLTVRENRGQSFTADQLTVNELQRRYAR